MSARSGRSQLEMEVAVISRLPSTRGVHAGRFTVLYGSDDAVGRVLVKPTCY